ncbi:hypothetical protein BJY04DRAFT_206827 [Aspergillus karnatakaensis]|uniref:uncharacterized protein n=1 Tax=Aspergillus karnatakaensis TaxID=1810916 RepID=UPI003CCDF478
MSDASDSDSCVTFHQYGQRCSALAPCRNCRHRWSGQEDGVGGAEQDHSSDPDYYRNLLDDLFRLVRSTDETGVRPVLDMVRNGAAHDDVRNYLDRAFGRVPSSNSATSSSFFLPRLLSKYEVESGVPAFRSKVMDVHYLCDSAPVKVPAKPWTTVTDDDALVSHLVSLYFTWDYPFYAFVDREILIKHWQMGNLQSDFCSPLLVNSLLANACHYSHYSEAYAVPGDVKTKGTDFLAEAERLLKDSRFEKGSVVRLASLQASLLLYERYSMIGDDDNGYIMLSQALEMAESLGIINSPHLDLNRAHMSEDMVSSVKRTAWGLFQIDTIVHTNFLRPSCVNEVSIERIDRQESKPTDIWIPYPTNRPHRPSWLSQTFDEACRLSYIARDMSLILSPSSRRPSGDIRQQKQSLFNDLHAWESALPPIFNPNSQPAPHIILLRMRYHALLINLYCDWFDGKLPFNHATGQAAPAPSTRAADRDSLEVALSSAREISSLTRLHKRAYGMDRAHQFAMYAILLALFAFLEQTSFNVLDHDFLSLTSAFSVIASRSQVGMNLFHIFRHSVRSRLECGKWESSIKIPTELEELFFKNDSSEFPDRWNHYAEGLQRLAERGEYIGSVDGGFQAHAASGINDMLRKARRIKCDETKPTCRNCARSKRDCAYASPSQDPKSNLRIVVYTPRASFATTGAEKHSLDFFLAQMRTRFPIHFSQPVLQAAHREDVLARAVIALGAMQQVFEYDDSSAIGTWSPMAQFAMQQYGKALRLLQDRVISNSRGMASMSPDILLISCIFFACFECLRGSTQAAIIHMRSGLNLLREYDDDPRTGLLIPRRTMRSLFVRLDNQIIEMRGSTLSMTSPQDCFEVIAGDPTPEDDVHDALNGFWNHILHGMLDAARAVAKGETPGPAITTSQNDIKNKMKALHANFTREPNAGASLGDDYGQDPDILHIWFLLSPMLLTANTWDPADVWGPHNDNFAQIVALAEGYLARESANHSSRKRTFSFSLGVVPALTLTASRSRDPTVQQKAMYLLSICNRREGIWDAKAALQIANRTVELDKSVSDTSSEEQAAIRLKNRAAAFDDVLVDEENSPEP